MHVALLVGARVVAGLVGAITGIVVPRALGVEQYGHYGLAVGIAGMLVVLSDLGLTTSLARVLAEGSGGLALAGRVLALRFASAVAAGAVLVGVGVAMRGGVIGVAHGDGGGRVLGGFLALCGALVLANGMLGVAVGLLPTLRRMRALLALTVVQPVLELVGVVLALTGGLGGAGVVGASTAAALVTGTVGLVVVAVALGQRSARTAAASVDGPAPAAGHGASAIGATATVGTVAAYGRLVFLVAIAYALFGVVDQAVIYVIRGPQEAGGYIAAWRLATLLHLPGLAAATIVAPRLVGGGPQRRAMYARWLALLCAFYVGAVAIAATLAPVLVPFALGEGYRPFALVFVVLAPYALLLGIAPHVTMAANFLGGAAERVRLGAATVALNVALDLALVPSLGAVGAAISSGIAFAMYVGAHAVLSWRLLGGEARGRGDDRAVSRARRARAHVREFGRGVLRWRVPVVVALAGGSALAADAMAGAAARLVGDGPGALLAGSLALATYGAMLALARRGGLLRMPGDTVAVPRTMPSPGLASGADSLGGVRVLHVCDFAAPYPGAFIRQLRMLDEQVRSRGGAPLAFAFPERARGATWIDALRDSGCDVHLLPDTSGWPARHVVEAVADVIAATGCDVVHSHFDAYDIATARAIGRRRRRAGTPTSDRPDAVLVWHYRTALEVPVERRGLARRAKDHLKYRIVGRRVDAAFAVTEALAREIAARGLGARASAVVAGCDTDTFRPDEDARAEVRAALGVDDDDVLVLHMGWHWHRKGGDLLVGAAGLLADHAGPRLVFASIGAPDDVDVGAVRRLEPTAGVQRYHQASDVFVSASRSEGFGNGLVEALACGRVAVAALVDGQRETFDGVEACRTVPVDDAAAIAAAIDELVSMRERWPALGAAGRAHVEQRFSMRRWAAQMADRYEHLVAREEAGVVRDAPEQSEAATGTPDRQARAG